MDRPAPAELHFAPNWSVTAKFDGEFTSGSQSYAGTGTLATPGEPCKRLLGLNPRAHDHGFGSSIPS